MAGNNRKAAKPVHNRSRRGWEVVPAARNTRHAMSNFIHGLNCREHRIKCDETCPSVGIFSPISNVLLVRFRHRNSSGHWSGTRPDYQLNRRSHFAVWLYSLCGDSRSSFFVDETPEVEAEYLDDSQGARNTAPSNELIQIACFNVAENADAQEDPVLSNEASYPAASGGDESLIDVPQYLDTAPIDNGPHPGLELNPSTNTASSTSNLPSNPITRNYHALPDIPFDLRLKAQLISTFFSETAAWFETTNSLGHFTVLYGHLVTKSLALGAAAMALASRYLELTKPVTRVSYDLYDFSNSLTTTIVEDNTLLLAVIIQCMFCAMSMDSGDALQSLTQCATLLRSSRWSRSTSGLPAAKAYLARSKTLLPPDIWFGHTPDWNSAPVQDSYSNRAIRIFARLVAWLSEERDSSRDPEQVRALWSALQIWNLERPDSLKPSSR
ncbi:hypothetical protein BDZ45DRAFT_744585 [Acephala macrosclerotiorum]|nr:hypothetical protein BDZ45DRAFT_744585 [Acephala macrosclerotiorum]